MTLSRQDRYALTRRVIRRTAELDRVRVLMMADARADGRGTVDHCPDSVNGTEVRASERWQESWWRKLHDELADVTEYTDAARIDPTAADGQARRDAYAAAHGLRKRVERSPRAIPADESDERLGRLLAIIGTSQADYD